MAALVGIPLGVAAVEYGPLNGIHKALKALVIKNPDGSPVTLFSLTGLPYWSPAVVIAAVTPPAFSS